MSRLQTHIRNTKEYKTGHVVDMDHALETLYKGLETTVVDCGLVQRVTANGPAILAHVGLVPGTPVLVRSFSNQGFNGIVAHVERTDMPGNYLTLQMADLDETALYRASRLAGRSLA